MKVDILLKFYLYFYGNDPRGGYGDSEEDDDDDDVDTDDVDDDDGDDADDDGDDTDTDNDVDDDDDYNGDDVDTDDDNDGNSEDDDGGVIKMMTVIDNKCKNKYFIFLRIHCQIPPFPSHNSTGTRENNVAIVQNLKIRTCDIHLVARAGINIGYFYSQCQQL